MTERDFILKTVGTIFAGGAVIGVASFLYSYDFSFAKSNFFMIAATEKTTGVQNDEKLYVDKTQEKNYQCRFLNKNYDCEIITKITIINEHNKIEFDKKLIDTPQDKTFDVNNLSQENNFLLIKPSKYLGKAINWNAIKDTTIDIVHKNNENKKFGTVKIVAGKNNEKVLGKIQYFLTKVEKISLDHEKISFVNVHSNVPNLCTFKKSNFSMKKIECNIYEYTNHLHGITSDLYSELPFVGKISENKKNNSIVEINEYYLVGLNSEQNNSAFLNKKLTYMSPIKQNNTSSHKVHFSMSKSASLFSISNDKQVLIIN